RVAVLPQRHHVAVLGRVLAIVDHGEGARCVAERRVRRDVLHQLAADIDPAAVADALEIFLAGHEHGADLAMQLDQGPDARTSTWASCGAQASVSVAPCAGGSPWPPICLPMRRARNGRPFVVPNTRMESP